LYPINQLSIDCCIWGLIDWMMQQIVQLLELVLMAAGARVGSMSVAVALDWPTASAYLMQKSWYIPNNAYQH